MKKKEKVIVFIAVVCMMLTVIFGYSYAYWTIRKEQTGMNQIASACLNIEFEEDNDIELKQAFPILDKDGEQLVPYTFTIRNTCDTYANYQINLETFDVAEGKTRMYDSYIKANLKKGEGRKFNGTLTNDIEVTPTISGATNAYKLVTGTLKNGNTHTYNLRVWMDQSVTMEDENAMNSSFAGKISVVFTAAVDPFAEAGTLQSTYSGYSQKLWGYKANITEVEFQNKMEPIVDAIESWDVSSTRDNSVMAYMINQGTDTEPEYKVYIQGNGGVKANPNSEALFYNFRNLNVIKGLEHFDTSNVVNMYNMFSNCTKLEELDLSKFDTSNVTDMSNMFSYCSQLKELDVSNFDTSNVTTMFGMFSSNPKLEKIIGLVHFDTSNVINMSRMFDQYYGSALIELDVSNFDTSSVTNMSSMFYNCNKLAELDLSKFDTSNVTDMSSMFYSCYKLEELDVSNFDTSNVTYMSSMFYSCSQLKELDLSKFDTSNVTDMSSMFYNCNKLGELDLSKFDTSNVTDMANMFSYCSQLKELDLSNFDTSNVTNMYMMFYNCSNLKELDVSNFDTSNVTNMSAMFSNVGRHINVFHLDLSNFDTSKVTNMSHMFDSFCLETEIIDLNLNSFDTTKVNNMSDMFFQFGFNSKSVNLNLSSFDTSNVINMSRMFESFGGSGGNNNNPIVNVDISHFNTINVNNMSRMFFQSHFINTELTIMNASADYSDIFAGAANGSTAQVTLNYTTETESLVDEIILNKPALSKIVKGIQVPNYSISLDSSYSSLVNLNSTSSYWGKTITLSPMQSNKVIKSFKLNGTLVDGDSFTMPKSNVTITDVNIVEGYTIESEHNPYANNINNEVYYENTFDGATSITVELTYQTESQYYDWVYLYTSPSTIYQNKKYGGTTLNTETITYNGNYIKLTFKTNGSGNNYYGFKAIIIPNYD